MWTDALNTFLDGYEPAKDLTDSSHQYSTQEIVQMLIKHTGEEVSVVEVVQVLRDMEYKYIKTGELELEWLFKSTRDY